MDALMRCPTPGGLGSSTHPEKLGPSSRQENQGPGSKILSPERRRRIYPVRVRGEGDCPYCLRRFDIRTYGQRFCSNECRARIGRLGETCAIEWRDCEICRTRYRALQPRQRFCAACSPTAWRAKLVGPRDLTCADCGAGFIAEGRGPHDRKRCPECQAVSAARRASHAPSAVRRRRGAKRIRGLRPRLLERYDGRCGPCGHPIDLSLPWQHPLALTIDHIWPISAGGSDDQSNLWPAHRRCNEEKSDEIGWRPDSTLFGQVVA